MNEEQKEVIKSRIKSLRNALKSTEEEIDKLHKEYIRIERNLKSERKHFNDIGESIRQLSVNLH